MHTTGKLTVAEQKLHLLLSLAKNRSLEAARCSVRSRVLTEDSHSVCSVPPGTSPCESLRWHKQNPTDAEGALVTPEGQCCVCPVHAPGCDPPRTHPRPPNK
ncbi:hypothetical protein NDU88_000365 [Pleurodeles waltl]|uniref:Uncharacterized protein n=1 Tax=Pleurodeles waltl TaxID=8319 RepID=A0AAV7LVM9_PLEWA|nr:hypothetical protein NDU88_000365 [Pleurodeles waltl]